MFSNTGLFRDVSCPYFLFGLCERPYCHFKHAKQEEAIARIEAERNAVAVKNDVEDISASATSALQQTLEAIENSIRTEKDRFTNQEKINFNRVTKTASHVKNKPTGTPAYNPTPLCELKKQKVQGKLGSSKYDLSLLNRPSSSSEYDPASNFTTPGTGSNSTNVQVPVEEPVPEYAKPLQSNTHRTVDDAEEDDNSSLAKIPKFVSIEYTPTVNETAEFSDEEPEADKEDSFSDFSEKGNESDKVSDVCESDTRLTTVISEKKDESKLPDSTSCGKNVLPIEFTADGFVKSVNVTEHLDTGSKNKQVEGITTKANENYVKRNVAKEGVAGEVKDKTDNIFNLFKEEFDSALESCNSSVAADQENSRVNSHSKVKQEFSIADNNAVKLLKDEKFCEIGYKKQLSLTAKEKGDTVKSPHKRHGDRHSTHHGSSEKDQYSLSSESVTKKIIVVHDKEKSEARNGALKSKHKSSSDRKDALHHKDVLNHKDRLQHKDVLHHKDRLHHKDALHHKDRLHHKDVLHHKDRLQHKDVLHHKDKLQHKDMLHHKDSSSSKQRHSLSPPTKHSHSLSLASKHKHSSSSIHTSLKHNHSPSKQETKISIKPNVDSHKSSKDKEKDRKLNGKPEMANSSTVSPKFKSRIDTSIASSSACVIKGATKRKILNLDVDLFGVDSDNEGQDQQKSNFGKDDDFSDIDQYFIDEDPFDECLRIFKEEEAKRPSVDEPAKKKMKKSVEQDNIYPAIIGKKRVALDQSNHRDKRKEPVVQPPKPKPSPAQVMMNRYRQIQETALQAEQDAKEKIKIKVREISAQNKEKAAATSTPSVVSANAAFSLYLSGKNKKTAAITASKGEQRKAHTPTIPIEKFKRPTVDVSSSAKVPVNIRQRYLNLFIDECLQLCSSPEEAYNRGKEEEAALFNRCTNKKIYLNIAVNTVKRLRTEKEAKLSNKTKGTAKTISHAAMLDGAGAGKATYTVNRSGGAVKTEEDFKGAELYKRLVPYILTEEQLKINNYPHQNLAKGGSAIFYGEGKNNKKGNTKGYEKLCLRCGKVFEVYPNGKYPIQEECVYHWGKAWKKKIADAIETRYTCCQGDLASSGCQVAKLHVHETNLCENFSGYMKTIPSSPPLDGDYGVYALDCEMVYTTMGVELARVTVVGTDGEPVYESLVLPDNPIVDLNTRFSGITEDDMCDVRTSLRDVQAVLLSLFTDKTILLGHSLESDLMALKLIHDTVVDTAIVFPHRMGHPLKRALRNLMSEYLKKIIQDDVGGHDSLEDAVACLQLMQYKLKDDARKEGRRLST